MALNLHGVVRGAINAVNPDQSILWRQSTGKTTGASGLTTPTYTDVPDVKAQVQALSGDDLRHTDFISQQGVKRAVYLFGNVQAINRPDALGGDLLVFPEVLGGFPKNWLVTHVLETWTPDGTGWCKVGVVLQADPVPL